MSGEPEAEGWKLEAEQSVYAGKHPIPVETAGRSVLLGASIATNHASGFWLPASGFQLPSGAQP